MKSAAVHSREKEAVMCLLRTADAVRAHFEQMLQPHGITLQQFNVLRILRGAGPEGLPTLDVGDRMVERAPGATRLLDRLEAKGLVRRVRCAEDRRRVLCYINEAGLDLLAGLDRAVVDADAAAVAALGARELDVLIGLLERIRASLE